ncbi:hypothetical protein ACFWD7_57550, partial [Streptomyces mirabilis]
LYDGDVLPTDDPSQHDQPEDHPTRPVNVTAPISQIMAASAHRTWQAKEIAHALGITGRKPFNSLNTQLGYWTRAGRLTRTAPSTYKITLPETLTATSSP